MISRIVTDYVADHLDRMLVSEVATAPVVVVRADETIAHVREWLSSHATTWAHQGFPVVDANNRLVGVVTRRDILMSPVGA